MSRKLLLITTFYYIKSFHHPHLQNGNHVETRPSSFLSPATLTISPGEGEGWLTSRFVHFRWKESITIGST